MTSCLPHLPHVPDLPPEPGIPLWMTKFEPKDYYATCKYCDMKIRILNPEVDLSTGVYIWYHFYTSKIECWKKEDSKVATPNFEREFGVNLK